MADPRATSPRTQVICGFALLFAVVMLRTAWLGDDAFITFRTVDNFVSGYGMRWNVVERVQSFTHPLWFFALSGAYVLTREMYFTVYALTAVLSVTAVVLALRRSASASTAILGGAALILSKAFVDYSTSGLENPLSHLLAVLFLTCLWRWESGRGSLAAAWWCGALLVLNRLDLALIVGPALAVATWRLPWRQALTTVVPALVPLVLWHLFALVYYGAPFPNTAYAKLQTGIAHSALMMQGLLYLLDSLNTDPVTLLVIACAVAATATGGTRRDWPLMAGVVLYLAYIVNIGGDFMTGRFLSMPLLISVVVLVRRPWETGAAEMQAALAVLAVLGVFATTRPPITSGASTFIMNAFDGLGPSGVADERAFYYRYTGLLRWSRERPLPWNAQVERGLALRAAPDTIDETNVGFVGFYAGPAATIVDRYGLCDPFLARQPVAGEWRIGHFLRPLPPGYMESVRTGTNRLVDPDLALQYEMIRRVTRDPIWSWRRLRAIRDLNGWSSR